MAAVGGAGYLAFRSGALRNLIRKGIQQLSGVKDSTLIGALEGLRAWSEANKRELAERGWFGRRGILMNLPGIMADAEVAMYRGIQNRRGFARLDYRDMDMRFDLERRFSSTAAAAAAMAERRFMGNEEMILRETERLADRFTEVWRDTVLADQRIQREMMRTTGYRRATVRDVLERNMLSTVSETRLRQLIARDESWLNAVVDENLLIDEKGQFADLRDVDNLFTGFIRSIEDDFGLPVVGFNPLRMFHTSTVLGARNKDRPFVYLLPREMMQPVVTGTQEGFMHDAVLIGNKLFSLDPGHELELIEEGFYLVNAQEKLVADSLRKMVGKKLVETKPKNAFGYVYKFLHLGEQDVPLDTFDPFLPTTWLSSVFRPFLGHNARFNPLRLEGEMKNIKTVYSEGKEWVLMRQYKPYSQSKDVWDYLSQFTAGRHNMDKVTTATLFPYQFFDRLNSALNALGFGLPTEDLGSAGAIFRNLLLYRAAPVIAGVYGWKYLNYEAENFLGEGNSPEDLLADAYVGMTVDLAYLRDAMGVTDWAKHKAHLFPGSHFITELPFVGNLLRWDRSGEEMEEYWESGEDPVRRGRYWPLGNTPWIGGKVDRFEPNWYRKLKSEWQYTETFYGSEDEFWANAPIPTPRYPLCVLPGQLIVLADSVVPIEEVPAGAITFNNEGLATEVVATLMRPANEAANKITVKGKPAFPLQVTANHPVFVVRPSEVFATLPHRPHLNEKNMMRWLRTLTEDELLSCARWVPAEQVQEGDLMISPRMTFGSLLVVDLASVRSWAAITDEWVYPFMSQDTADAVEKFEAGQIPKGTGDLDRDRRIREKARRRLRNGSIMRYPRYIPVSDDLAVIMGVYLAEGHRSQPEHSGAVLNFTLNASEQWIAERLCAAAKALAGPDANVVVERHNSDNCIRVRIHVSWLADAIAAWCGQGADKKHLPGWFFDAPQSFAETVLSFYIAGDGWNSEGNVEGSKKAKTVSKVLAAQMVTVAEALGIAASVKMTASKRAIVMGRECVTKDAYTISFPAGHQKSAIIREHLIFREVVENKQFHYVGPVYDLEVSEGASFTTITGIVHNSPIRHFFTDPYHYEKKHYYDRPYPLTGGIPEIEEFPLIGPFANATIGQLLKPQRRMHVDMTDTGPDWEGYAEDMAALGYTPVDVRGNFGGAVTAGEGWLSAAPLYLHGEGPAAPVKGFYGGGEYIPLPVPTLAGPASTDRQQRGQALEYAAYVTASGNVQIMQYDPAVVSYNSVLNSLAEQSAQRGGMTPVRVSVPLPELPQAQPLETPWERVGGEVFYNITEMAGFYGFSANTLLGLSGTGPEAPRLADAQQITSYNRMWWDLDMGGFGGNLSEIGRRFLPKEDHTKDINPIPNTMPDWLPGEEYFTNYQTGDPYAKIKHGEIRLPGAAYEAIYEVPEVEMLMQIPEIRAMVENRIISRGDLYGPVARFRILADVAPYSEQFRQLNAQIGQFPLSEEERKEIQEIRRQLRERKDNLQIIPYRFRYADVAARQVTVKRLIEDPHAGFMVVTYEYPNNPIKLAGLRVPMGKDDPVSQEARAYLRRVLAPGKTVTIQVDADPLKMVSSDTYDSIRAVVLAGGFNVNRYLIERGLAVEDEDDFSAPAVHARFSDLDILVGRLWESIAHRDTMFNTKYLQVRSALESYERRDLYGKSFQEWSEPIRDYLVPTFQSFIRHNPILATGLGALFGAQFGHTPFGRLVGAVLGGAAVGAGALYRAGYEEATGEAWIPGRRLDEREVNEYFDMLKYVKYMRLYAEAAEEAKRYGFNVQEYLRAEKAAGETRAERKRFLEEGKKQIMLDPSQSVRVARELRIPGPRDAQSVIKAINQEIKRLANARDLDKIPEPAVRAIMYYREAQRTMFAYDPGDPFQDLMAALPRRDRDYLPHFIKAPPQERERILEIVPRYLRRPLQAAWGMEVEEGPSLIEYFTTHGLPDQSWAGWRPEVSLEAVKIKFINHQGLDRSEFNVYPDDVKKAMQDPTPIPIMDRRRSVREVEARLRSLFHGAGIEDLEIDVVPAKTNGLKVTVDLRRDRRKEIEEYLNENYYEVFFGDG